MISNEPKTFDSTIRLRSVSSGFEVTVKIESTITSKPAWVEHTATYTTFPESFKDLIDEAVVKFNKKLETYR